LVCSALPLFSITLVTSLVLSTAFLIHWSRISLEQFLQADFARDMTGIREMPVMWQRGSIK
jgi:hypothetical protein